MQLRRAAAVAAVAPWLVQPALRIQYIPGVETPQEDQSDKPVTPTSISVEAGELSITVRVTPGAPLEPNDRVEVYASIDNNRANAQRVAWGATDEFTDNLPTGGTRWYWTRIRREINGPDVFSEWLPSSATGGVVQTALDFAGELPAKGGVFLDTFEHQDIDRFYDIRLGDKTGLTYPTDGENGARVLQIASGAIGITWKKNIPYDPTKIYLMTVKARVTVDGPSAEFVTAGIEGVAADGVTIINRTGGTSVTPLHSFAVSNTSWVTGTWQTFRGYLSGHSSSVSSGAFPNIDSPSPAYASGGTVVRYIRPCLLINPITATGTIQIDYMRIDIVETTATLGPSSATSILTARDDGPDSFNPSSGGNGYLSVSGPGIDSASVLNGSLTIDAQQADVITLSGIALEVTWSGGSEATPTAQPVHTDRRAYSFQHSFTTLPMNTAWTMRVAMSGNANITVQRAALRAEVIKR